MTCQDVITLQAVIMIIGFIVIMSVVWFAKTG